MSFDLQGKFLEIKENWQQLLVTLGIGLVGSLVFVYLKLPLPWIIGALFTTTCAAMMGVELWVPNWLRLNAHLILGALFGTSVTPEFLTNFIKWIPSMIAVTAYVVVVMPPIILYLIRVAKLDIVTAYFSAAPGGLVPMAAMGGSVGGDEKTISLIQSARIIMTVLIIPFSFALWAGYEPTGAVGTGGTFNKLSILDGAILLATVIIGYAIARPLRIPTPYLMGPMIAVAIISMTGVSSAQVPDSLAAIAQWVIGSNIGTMFNKVKPKVVALTLIHGSITSVFMVAFATGAAIVTQQLTGQSLYGLVRHLSRTIAV
ncbi:MAG: AbrB family transcriptional regulator, partial [Rhodospirillaceae bacterium]|nr:AbrB family transcriptional regulator [Rhodospirillaceae bacterium]